MQLKTKKSKQYIFSHAALRAPKVSYGGEARTKGRKYARPVVTNRDIHLVLKSKRAHGALSFYKHKILVQTTIQKQSDKFFVEIKEIVNMGNHLHIRLRAHNRKGFGQFLKSVTCLIARKITNARRGHIFGRFWQGVAFTRILKSSLEGLQLKHYFAANRIEFVEGYQARQMYLDRVNIWIRKLKKLDGELTKSPGK